ncbi:MAG: hypothetical protein IIX61_03365 [Loktanella sp.]|nr:hypothetical protein [Loktanella sp.]
MARLCKGRDIVVVADRDLAAAERAVGAIGNGSLAFAPDVTDSQSCAAMADRLRGMGKLVTLVNAAGASFAESLHGTRLD